MPLILWAIEWILPGTVSLKEACLRFWVLSWFYARAQNSSLGIPGDSMIRELWSQPCRHLLVFKRLNTATSMRQALMRNLKTCPSTWLGFKSFYMQASTVNKCLKCPVQQTSARFEMKLGKPVFEGLVKIIYSAINTKFCKSLIACQCLLRLRSSFHMTMRWWNWDVACSSDLFRNI